MANVSSWKTPAAQNKRTMNVTIGIDDQDLKDFLKVMNKMGKDANTDLKREVVKISEITAMALRFSASSTRQKIIGNTIRAGWDRLPTVRIGGSKKMSSRAKYGDKGGTVGDALFGIEFGAHNNFLKNGGRSFPTRSVPYGTRGGLRGYWIFPTLRKMQPEIRRRWYQAVDDLLEVWDN
jgi:hypothetical protein